MKAAAFVVGATGVANAALMEIAHGVGFEAVMPFRSIGQAKQQMVGTPICFFLFAPVADVGTLRGVAEAIRFSTSHSVRFSPLIYFSESPLVQTISRCINMGFDDIITMPVSSIRVAERLERQVGHNLTFYETAGYFGPDRRNRVPAPTQPVQNRVGGQYRRIEIVRNPVAGVEVVRDDFFAAPA